MITHAIDSVEQHNLEPIQMPTMHLRRPIVPPVAAAAAPPPPFANSLTLFSDSCRCLDDSQWILRDGQVFLIIRQGLFRDYLPLLRII